MKKQWDRPYNLLNDYEVIPKTLFLKEINYKFLKNFSGSAYLKITDLKSWLN